MDSPQKDDSSLKGLDTTPDLDHLKAIELLGDTETLELSHNDTTARRLRRKIDLRLIPMLCLTYALQSIDKTTLSYAAVFGLREDLHLQGNQYSWASGIFYLGYLAWEFPTNVLLQRLPIQLYMSSTIIVWGGVLMCHAAAINFGGLAAIRTILGTLESSVNPGMMLLISMYYMRSEQPFRMGLCAGSGGLGYVIAGIASFALGSITGSVESWKILFLFWGAVTIAWGVFLAFKMPGSTLTTKFLDEHERDLAIDRVKQNGTGVENRSFKVAQFYEAMLDLKTWLLFFFAVASNSPNGGLTTFQGLVIKGMGFSALRTTLIQMPSGAVQMIVCPLACYCATRFPNSRLLIMIICLFPFLAGVVGLWCIDQSQPYGRLVCLWISFTYTATWTLSMTVATANTAGHTKKITTNALLLIGYCLGNFVGPFFFTDEQAPVYSLGVGMMFFCTGLQLFCLSGLWVLLWTRNKKRRAMRAGDLRPQEEIIQEVHRAGLADETDFENLYFEYVY